MKTNMMTASKFIQWSVLGDGCVSFATHNKDAHYSITRSLGHEDYLGLIQRKLEVIPNVSVSINQYSRKDNGAEVLSLRTNSHPIFTRIRERQYIDSRRVVDPHMLTTLDWEALAFLYMDDGSLCYNSKGVPIVRISTCAYSFFEQSALRIKFIDKLGVIFNVNKTGRKESGIYQLNLASKSMTQFFAGIEPHIVNSYRYKLPLSLQEDAPIAIAA